MIIALVLLALVNVCVCVFVCVCVCKREREREKKCIYSPLSPFSYIVVLLFCFDENLFGQGLVFPIFLSTTLIKLKSRQLQPQSDVFICRTSCESFDMTDM